MIANNITVSPEGHLLFAGRDTVELARKYGTPLWLLDEALLRANCRAYTETLRAEMGENSFPLYASKALCFRALYPILLEEKMHADAVSANEIATALSAGFPAERIWFHGSNTPPAEIDYAVENGVGHIIIDNLQEIAYVSEAARRHGIRQKVLLRLTPGIDPHTFAAVDTASFQCQFGVPVYGTMASDFVHAALSAPGLDVCGYHCHVGSQIFDAEPFLAAANILLEFAAQIRRDCGYTPAILDLGGGFGVPYTADDPAIDLRSSVRDVCRGVKELCGKYGLPVPALLLEPGRSIVADAGMTLYTAGTVKHNPGRNFVLVDGGMSDNPRYALYGSLYTVYNASHADRAPDSVYTVAGRCCESGALIHEGTPLYAPVTGDILAVCTTGAYNYTMSSNYNRLAKPPIVLLRTDGTEKTVVRRQTLEDLISTEPL